MMLRGTSLWAWMRQHANGFDLFRLAAAVLVLWSHQHALMGLPEPTVAVLQGSIGGLGLYIFFAVSGYLNTISASRHRSMLVFLFNRALRIYPALAVCTAFDDHRASLLLRGRMCQCKPTRYEPRAASPP
jgi:peptidoglycan/LPS O-acetylase OafA/YrhL